MYLAVHIRIIKKLLQIPLVVQSVLSNLAKSINKLTGKLEYINYNSILARSRTFVPDLGCLENLKDLILSLDVK